MCNKVFVSVSLIGWPLGAGEGGGGGEGGGVLGAHFVTDVLWKFIYRSKLPPTHILVLVWWRFCGRKRQTHGTCRCFLTYDVDTVVCHRWKYLVNKSPKIISLCYYVFLEAYYGAGLPYFERIMINHALPDTCNFDSFLYKSFFLSISRKQSREDCFSIFKMNTDIFKRTAKLNRNQALCWQVK